MTPTKKDPTPIIEHVANLLDWVVYGLPPGPPLIPLRVYVNLHKGSMFFYILLLMWYFDNYT